MHSPASHLYRITQKTNAMKKILLMLLLSAGCNLIIFAQCTKKVTWTASKADFLDESGNLQQSKDVKVTIQTTSKEIRIVHSDDEADTLQGPVKEDTCQWNEPFKKGKTILKADLTERDGTYSNCLLTIEGLEGKILISLKVEAPDGRKFSIKIPVDSYKEE